MKKEEFRSLLRSQHVEESAPLLLGAQLVAPNGSGIIVEVEAYAGSDDPGSHAFRGKSPKNASMFGEPGHAYVYFTYGNHWMLNLVAHDLGHPAAILIRAIKPTSPLDPLFTLRPKARTEYDLLSGPGKLTAALGIDRRYDGIDLLTDSSPISITPVQTQREYIIGKRVGIAIGRGDETPWRFVDSELQDWASRPRPRLA